jgi:hypothetical protein
VRLQIALATLSSVCDISRINSTSHLIPAYAPYRIETSADTLSLTDRGALNLPIATCLSVFHISVELLN